MEQTTNIIDLIYQAKKNGVDIVLNGEQLQLKVPKNIDIDQSLLAEIKNNKQLIIDFLLNENGKLKTEEENYNGIKKLDKEITNIPLSFSQKRLWFIDQLEGSVQYHMPVVRRLKGKLNKEALANALQSIVNRHEVLRTVILEQEGEPYQFVMDAGGWQLELIDGSSYEQDPAGLQKYIHDLISKPFNLAKDYMIRAHLILLSEEEYVLLVTMHHIASDGWSTSIFIDEVMEFYNAYVEQRPSALRPLPIQYSDYALWQRNHLHGEVLDKKIVYWKDKLKGVSVLQIPTDNQRPEEWSSHGAVLRFNIDKLISDKLQALSKQESATIFMTLLAAFKVLLQRYSGQKDICVGSPIANRTHKDIEGLIGFFVNTIALRSEVKSDDTFTDLLQKVRLTTLEAYEHQDVPFEKVVELVVKDRDMSRNPLFQVMLIMQNTPKVQALHLGEVQLSVEKYISNTAHFDITFSIAETPHGLEGVVEYATDLYSESTIMRMIVHFKNLLNAIVKNPEQRIGKLGMLSAMEERQLLIEFNDTAMYYPKDKTVVDLFEEQVIKTPGAIAVVFEQEELSYAGLNEKANQLAHYLRDKGIGEEALVPICIERGSLMIIGLLGILKAGAAYVPVDPEYPKDRIKFMFEDINADIIISSKNAASNLESIQNLTLIELDTDWPLINEKPVLDLQNNFSANRLAYVIYTSGSTGKPKGVMIEHGNAASFIYWCRQEFSNSRFKIVYASTSICFDLSVFEIFYPLSIGKCLRVIENGLFIGQYLPSDTNVLVNSVPSVIQSLLNNEKDIKNISAINMAGEPIPLQVQHALDADRIEIRNLYGPTEDTTYSTIYRLKKGEIATIGRPISNTQIYILNNEMDVIPIGITGEICIGGDGLARGYFNREKLTQEKFIKNPFIKEHKARIYKTGDIGRWLPDGTIECLGRKDDQVKIRGYRIELGEIESVLQQCEKVSQGVVLVKEDTKGNKRLVGYVVPEGVFDKAVIISNLKNRLPEYMIPDVLVEIKEIPLTPNGKIDKKSFPDFDAAEVLNVNYIAPRNETEEMIAKIWEEVLEIEKVGMSNNFFELGGHSLVILKLASKIRELGLKIEVKDFFKYQTIEQQSNFIKTSLKILHTASEGKFVIPIQPEGNNIPLFGIPEFLLYSELGKFISRDQPLYSIEHSHLTAGKEVANHYVTEIQKTLPHGPYALMGYCDWGKVILQIAQILIARGEEVPVLVLTEYYAPSLKMSRTSVKYIKQKTRLISRKINEQNSIKEKKKFIFNQLKECLVYIKEKLKSPEKRTSVSITKRYHYSGKVILFQASQTIGFKDDPLMGWNEVFTGEVKKYIIEGDHLGMMASPDAAAQMAEILNADLKAIKKVVMYD